MKYGTRFAGLTLALAITTSFLAGCQFEDRRAAEAAEPDVSLQADLLAAQEPAPAQKMFWERYIKGNKGFFQPEKKH